LRRIAVAHRHNIRALTPERIIADRQNGGIADGIREQHDIAWLGAGGERVLVE
jgi:hypothetical protein